MAGVALFDRDELKLGKLLGEGGYSYVYELDGIQTRANRSDPCSDDAARDRLVKRSHQRDDNGDSRYVVKVIRESRMVDEVEFKGAADALLEEATVLSKLSHPHIINVRGWSMEGMNAPANGKDSCFIILDRLYDILDDRVLKWRQEMERLPKGSWRTRRRNSASPRGGERDLFLAERLKVACDIASALDHLHERRIVYRDLKPNNVGFDYQGVTKLFDFGFCRELPCDHGSVLVKDEVFKMSGGIGTRRYMSPEVARSQPYNETCDVYSFSILLWEMLALEKPFAAFSRNLHEQRVVERGERPKVDTSWPRDVQEIMTRAWHADLRRRPSMKEIQRTLKTEVCALEDDGKGLKNVPTEDSESDSVDGNGPVTIRKLRDESHTTLRRSAFRL